MNGSGAIELFHKMLEARETKRNELTTQLGELEQEIQSIQHTYQLYRKEQGIPEIPQAPLFEHGLSLTKRRQQALIAWAERNNRMLIPKEAKKALIAAGLAKPGKSAGWILYGTIANMECWEKLKPGQYRLITTNSSKAFHVGARVCILPTNDDAPIALLGINGTIIQEENQTDRTGKTVGRTGKMLWTPWYMVRFDRDKGTHLINEAWLQPL